MSITLTNISKQYKLYKSQNDRLKESLSFSKKKYHKIFYALKNISFTINKGEVVGILGKNGSGKSTLLKIIAGVLTQSNGNVKVNGKITALLELGAGFNPELTGLENLYLSGSISGFSRIEIDKKIDDIIDFADIDEFINQPLKTYSSGMKARLGFAFAINSEPEILIVDEALSVGDAAFARKCYAKIEDMCKSKEITVLFVSHSDGIIKQLCNRAIMLHNGQFIVDGDPKDVVNIYNKTINSKNIDLKKIKDEFTNIINNKNKIDILNNSVEKKDNSFFNKNFISKSIIEYPELGAKISDVRLTTFDNKKVNIIEQNKNYFYKYKVTFLEDFENIRFAMQIKSKTGIHISGKSSFIDTKNIEKVNKNDIYEVSWMFKNILNEGEYLFNCAVNNTKYGEKTILHRVLDAYLFKVIQPKENKSNGLVDFGYQLEIEKIV
ncbi:MAG: ABC transporter ATP-binding protein [Campylobacterota bacterium]|nr:ABC transporter ATP-binding protein [Campylobacterota bacterium]